MFHIKFDEKRDEDKMSSSISYYENLIVECNGHIRKYKEQIEGLESFEKENANGIGTFTAVTIQRRNQIDTSLADSVKHPMVMKLHRKINNAINGEYENGVLNNFNGVKSEIIKAVNQLLDRIEEEEKQISIYRNRIAEIREEERREAERRAAERREADRRAAEKDSKK